MVDARLQGHWLTDPIFDGLSDREWRTFTGSLMWAAEHGTDGKLTARSLRLLHPDGVDEVTANALIAAGKWTESDARFAVADWARHQSLAADVERQRESNRQRQAKYRASQRGDSPVTSDVTRDVTGESLRQGESKAAVKGELAGNSALQIANATGCNECQRRAAFGQPPCTPHRGHDPSADDSRHYSP